MKAALMIVGWALTVAAAFFAGEVMGGGTGTDAPDDGAETPAEVARLREQVEELTAELEEKGTQRERVAAGALARRDDAGSTAPAGRPAAATAPEPGATAVTAFSIANATSAEEASRQLMAFAATQLSRGEEGHAAIMDALAEVWTNRDTVKELLGDETQAVRELYPWVRFLVQREDEMVDLSDYVFRTMAEDPMAFEKLPDDDILEIFTEGVAILLPGAVDEERLAEFRGYARAVLETPESEQPKAVAGNRRRIERLLATFWAEPIDPLEAFERLKTGDVPTGEIARLLRLVPPEMLAQLDVGALVTPLLQAGNHDAIRVISGNPNLTLEAWKTDQAVLDGMAAGDVQSWFLRSYFSALGHDEWTDVRPFFDRAIGAGGKSLEIAVQFLSRYAQPPMRPDAVYVADVLARHQVEANAAKLLKRVYGLEEE